MRFPISALFGLALILGGCVPAASRVEGGQPVPDPAGLVEQLAASTLPASPLQVNFDWQLNEGGSRVRGRGVVRIEAPRRIRLDLFGQRGDTYLSAALVDGVYRFPSAAAPAIELPSPALLWGALGIFQPPETASLDGAVADSLRTDIEFVDPAGDRWIFHFSSEGGRGDRLTGIEREGRRGLIESVTLESDSTGVSEARYRDWTNYRELDLSVSEVRPATPFPPDIWSPGVPTF